MVVVGEGRGGGRGWGMIENDGESELRSCVKVEVDVLGSPSLINPRFLWT